MQVSGIMSLERKIFDELQILPVFCQITGTQMNLKASVLKLSRKQRFRQPDVGAGFEGYSVAVYCELIFACRRCCRVGMGAAMTKSRSRPGTTDRPTSWLNRSRLVWLEFYEHTQQQIGYYPAILAGGGAGWRVAPAKTQAFT